MNKHNKEKCVHLYVVQVIDEKANLIATTAHQPERELARLEDVDRLLSSVTAEERRS